MVDLALNGLGAPDLRSDLAVLEACSTTLAWLSTDDQLKREFNLMAAYARSLNQSLDASA